jgi:hypothetical protein
VLDGYNALWNVHLTAGESCGKCYCERKGNASLNRTAAMQTISIPHRLSPVDQPWLDNLRREQAIQMRMAYVRAASRSKAVADQQADNAWTFHPENDVRRDVLAKVPPVAGDTWTSHCAIREGIAARKATPNGKAIFGSKGQFHRRRKGLIDEAQWRRDRLRPFISYGDRLYRGNRFAKLVMVNAEGKEVVGAVAAADPMPKKRERTKREGAKVRSGSWVRNAAPAGAKAIERLTSDILVSALRLTVKGTTVTIPLVAMRGKQGKLLTQAAFLASQGLLNLTVRIDDNKVHVTFDAMALSSNPEARKPIQDLPGRIIGIDRNPNAIGLTAIKQVDGKAKLAVLDHALVVPNLAKNCPAEVTAEAMSQAAETALGMARKHHCGIIAVERLKGLRGLNGLLSRWARETFLTALKRRAALCGIKVVEVWGGYSTTIGNVVYDLPDACAAAAEIGRRGLASLAKEKELLPVWDADAARRGIEALADVLPAAQGRRETPKGSDRRKERVGVAKQRCQQVLAKLSDVAGWKELHRALKKSRIRARRPHPVRGSLLVVSARLGPSATGHVLWSQPISQQDAVTAG